MCLEGKVSVSDDMVSKVPQGSILEPLLFILYTSELFHIVGNYMVGYEDDTTMHAVIPRPVSRPQVIDSLNRKLAAIHSWYLKWHMRLNPRMIKSMVINRAQTNAPGYDDLTLAGAEV